MKDMLGQEVGPGDYFAYALMVGRSANMAIYKFVEEVTKKKTYSDEIETKVRAIKLHESYGAKAKDAGSWHFRVWDGVNYRNMTPEEMHKAMNKTTVLGMFEARGLLLPGFNPEDFK
jgi:hypothetical protein